MSNICLSELFMKDAAYSCGYLLALGKPCVIKPSLLLWNTSITNLVILENCAVLVVSPLIIIIVADDALGGRSSREIYNQCVPGSLSSPSFSVKGMNTSQALG